MEFINQNVESIIDLLSGFANWGGIILASIALIYDICLRMGGKAANFLWRLSKFDFMSRWWSRLPFLFIKYSLYSCAIIIAIASAIAAFKIKAWNILLGSIGIVGFIFIWNKCSRERFPVFSSWIEKNVRNSEGDPSKEHKWLETQSILIAAYGIVWEILHKIHIIEKLSSISL